MDEKLNNERQDQPTEKKKVYTPPAVTQYGKLTDLTASGTGTKQETKGNPDSMKKP